MIPVATENSITGNAIFVKSEKFEIDEAAMAHVMETLSKMYENPLLAVAREHISNGFDAMVASMGLEDTEVSSYGVKIPQPVEVSLPNTLNPTFIVRDYGVGMSAETLSTVFRKYGASTKRENNSEIGGFGYGAKSGFAVSSNFVVVTVHEGKKNTIIISKDEAGVGVANYLLEVDTDEPSGTTVTISLPNPGELASVFKDDNLLLGFPDGSIMVDGALHTRSVYNTEMFTPVADNGWILNSSLNVTKEEQYSRPRVNKARYTKAITVVVGPISYQVEVDSFTQGLDIPYNTQKFLAESLVMRVGIGTVSLTPSRDTLIMDSVTIKTLAERFVALAEAVEVFIQDEVSESETHKDAFTRAEQLRYASYQNDLFWQGELIPPSRISSAYSETVEGEEEVITYHNYASGTHFNSRTRVQTVAPGLQDMTGQQFFLVTDVMNQQEAETLNRYRRAFINQKHKNASDKMNFVYATARAELVNPWHKAAALEVFTAAEFLEKGKELRKQAAALARANRATNGVTAPATKTLAKFTALSSNYQKSQRPNTNTRYASSYADSRLAYVAYDAAETNSLSYKVWAATGASDPEAPYRLINSVLGFVSAHRLEESFTVIRIPKNINMNAVYATFPGIVSLDEAVEEVSEQLSALTESEWLAAGLASLWSDIGSWHGLTTYDTAVENIANTKLREALETFQVASNFVKTDTANQELGKAAMAIAALSEDNDFTFVAQVKAQQVKVANLISVLGEFTTPLVETCLCNSRFGYRMPSDLADELVEYFNMKFPN